ncbi:MAG: class I SAM-dependent methyltransferase [Ruminococcaceae bacterium]|nr:class I SAM-dependent methyltransferase [Oscillospiraceae bacterium]
MAYQDFAYWYDSLNTEADYDRLADEMVTRLARHGVPNGIVADLGCGTGELCLRLAAHGYDMIGVDASPDMLSVFREKAAEQGRGDILLLCQDLAKLDLYGTIRAAVSSFDTLNHLDEKALAETVERVALFMEKGGVFIFDVNTPHKHAHVLANNVFEIETGPQTRCVWENRYDPEQQATHISVTGYERAQMVFRERFIEYAHMPDKLAEILQKNGLKVLEQCDGERFGPVLPTSQRLLVTARKI